MRPTGMDEGVCSSSAFKSTDMVQASPHFANLFFFFFSLSLRLLLLLPIHRFH